MPDAAIGRHAIGAGQRADGHVEDAGTMGPHIRALVMEDLVVDREEMARGVDRSTDAMALLARVIGSDQVLAPILEPFDRSPEAQARGADEEILGIELAANAEA